MKVETISFKTEYAEKYGIECAILIQGIQLGLMINRNKPTHNKMGKVWMYNSVKDWNETYPFMSESTIKRSLNKLKECKVIEVMQLDSNPMNKTNWYTLTNALGHFEPIEEVKLTQSKQYKTNSIKQTIDSVVEPPRKEVKKFVKPTIDEIQKEFVDIDAERFYNYYESKGWLVGNTKMKNWKAAATNWIAKDKPKPTTFTIKNRATLNDD
jgi:hypothetical protein